jgi:hypothetical protein
MTQKRGKRMKYRNNKKQNSSSKRICKNEMLKKGAVATGAVIGAVGLVNNEVFAESEKEVTQENLATHDEITVKDEASASLSESAAQSESLSAQEAKSESEQKSFSASTSTSKAESLKASESTRLSESEKVATEASLKASQSTSLSEEQASKLHSDSITQSESSSATSESESASSQSVLTTSSMTPLKAKMATVNTQEETSETVTKMTNKEDYSSKKIYTIDETGKTVEANKTQATQTKDYLNSQNVTADVDIYANNYNATIGHIDGNIAVKNLNTSVQVYNKDQYGVDTSGSTTKDISAQYSKNGYSYIGNATETASITNGDGGTYKATLVFGSDAQKTNAYNNVKDNTVNYYIMTIEEAKTSSDSRFSELDQLINIEENLNTIGNKGKEIIDSTTTSADGYSTLVDLGNSIASGQYTNNDVISVTVSSDIFTDNTHTNDWQNNQVFSKLYSSNANKNNTNILINVDVKDGVDTIDLGKIGTALMNATQSYSSRAAYVTWNFGNFSGTFKGSFSGNLIAPKATFDGVEIRSGRVVANNVSHSGELHMAVKGTYKTEHIHSNSESNTQSESTTQSDSHSGNTSTSESKGSGSNSNSESTSTSTSESTSESGSGSTSEYSTSETQSASTSVTTSESTSESGSSYHNLETESTSVSYTSEDNGSGSNTDYNTSESTRPSTSEATVESSSASTIAKTSETMNRYETAETGTSNTVATGDPTNIAVDVAGVIGGAAVAGVTLTKKHKK